jgi:hypothetical protein
MLKPFIKSTVSKITNEYFTIYKIFPKRKFQFAFILRMQNARGREYCKKDKVTKRPLTYSCLQQQVYVSGHCSTIHHALKAKLN